MSQSKKHRNLEMLFRFAQQERVVGGCSNMLYNMLANSYPCHFLIYTQYSIGKNGRKDESKNLIKEEINYRIERILSLPLEKNDGELFDYLIDKLDEMIAIRVQKLNN